MLRILGLLVVVVVAGLASGFAGYLVLGPPVDLEGPEASVAADTEPEFARLSNQFVIPVVDSNRVRSLVVLSLTVETAEGQSEAVFSMEPRLRDDLIQVLFDHANTGGFSGSFTAIGPMTRLRLALTEAARTRLGDDVRAVLITDIIRQEI